MSREITHPGVVRSVEPGIVRVAIVANSACHSCRARQACGMSESAEKMVDVETSDYARYAAGDAVTVGRSSAWAQEPCCWPTAVPSSC